MCITKRQKDSVTAETAASIRTKYWSTIETSNNSPWAANRAKVCCIRLICLQRAMYPEIQIRVAFFCMRETAILLQYLT